jgi:hypothetical protein
VCVGWQLCHPLGPDRAVVIALVQGIEPFGETVFADPVADADVIEATPLNQ